jgi:hypothetical protein
MDCVAANAGLRRYYAGLGFRTVGTVAIRGTDFALLERAVGAPTDDVSSPSGARRP